MLTLAGSYREQKCERAALRFRRRSGVAGSRRHAGRAWRQPKNFRGFSELRSRSRVCRARSARVQWPLVWSGDGHFARDNGSYREQNRMPRPPKLPPIDSASDRNERAFRGFAPLYIWTRSRPVQLRPERGWQLESDPHLTRLHSPRPEWEGHERAEALIKASGVAHAGGGLAEPIAPQIRTPRIEASSGSTSHRGATSRSSTGWCVSPTTTDGPGSSAPAGQGGSLPATGLRSPPANHTRPTATAADHSPTNAPAGAR